MDKVIQGLGVWSVGLLELRIAYRRGSRGRQGRGGVKDECAAWFSQLSLSLVCFWSGIVSYSLV